MGLFGKMFEKKTCSICGGEIGLLGNRKLEDSNLCKECAGKLSPFFSDRRASTVEQIAEQLEYREANRQKVAELNVTRTLGCDMKVMLNEDAKRFIVTRNSRWRDANPDVMDFSQVTGCDTEIRETRSELTWKDDEGHSQSYDPPRYDIDYDVYVTIHVNSPYFNEITFKVNDYRIEERNSVEYREAERQAQHPAARDRPRAGSGSHGSENRTNLPVLRRHHRPRRARSLRVLRRRDGIGACRFGLRQAREQGTRLRKGTEGSP